MLLLLLLLCHSRADGNLLFKSISKDKNMNTYFVYILASKKNGTLYVGVTNNLLKRIYEHKHNKILGFTSQYGVHKLVYYENCSEITIAIQREKQIKKWNRIWKIRLIEEHNVMWEDLYGSLVL